MKRLLTEPERITLGIATLNESLLRSNPIWALELTARHAEAAGLFWVDKQKRVAAQLATLQRQGVAIPSAGLHRLIQNQILPAGQNVEHHEASPRVVGMLIDHWLDESFASPFETETSVGWSVASNLQGRESAIRSIINEIQRHERIAGVFDRTDFAVRDRLARNFAGASVDIPAVLSMIDAANGHQNNVFRCVCSLVERRDNALQLVGSADRKLKGFLREYGEGSLLLLPDGVHLSDLQDSGTLSPEEADAPFEQIWHAGTLQELTDRLADAGLLQVFQRPISHIEAPVLARRIEQIVNQQHNYAEGLDLIERTLRCGLDANVEVQTSRHFVRIQSDALRHLGRYERAVAVAGDEYDRILQSGTYTSHDQTAAWAATYAAALRDQHDFPAMCRILEPIVEHLTNDEKAFSPLTRVMVLNTLGNAEIAMANPERKWETRFRKSLEIQSGTDRYNQPRTANDLIHGLLRSDRLADADLELQSWLPNCSNSFSAFFLKFAAADLARRRGDLFEDPELESATADTVRVGHPIAYYFQATARQVGRNAPDAAVRFRKAVQLFQHDLTDDSENSILDLLIACMKLGVGLHTDDRRAWCSAADDLQRFLDVHGGPLLSWYGACVHQLGKTPDSAALERLLERVPYL